LVVSGLSTNPDAAKREIQRTSVIIANVFRSWFEDPLVNVNYTYSRASFGKQSRRWP
jgi:hypothetical protein